MRSWIAISGASVVAALCVGSACTVRKTLEVLSFECEPSVIALGGDVTATVWFDNQTDSSGDVLWSAFHGADEGVLGVLEEFTGEEVKPNEPGVREWVVTTKKLGVLYIKVDVGAEHICSVDVLPGGGQQGGGGEAGAGGEGGAAGAGGSEPTGGAGGIGTGGQGGDGLSYGGSDGCSTCTMLLDAEPGVFVPHACSTSVPKIDALIGCGCTAPGCPACGDANANFCFKASPSDACESCLATTCPAEWATCNAD